MGDNTWRPRYIFSRNKLVLHFCNSLFDLIKDNFGNIHHVMCTMKGIKPGFYKGPRQDWA